MTECDVAIAAGMIVGMLMGFVSGWMAAY